MAKKKGKREEAFTFPKFDSEEYRTKEVRDSKVTVFAVFYAIVVALICYSLVMASTSPSLSISPKSKKKYTFNTDYLATEKKYGNG